jgi:hypothetical protein
MRWSSSDPAGMINGPNLYAYVSNSPMRFIDKTGMAEVSPGVESTWIEITIDHILARARGGGSVNPDNLAFLPRSDNSSKGIRLEGDRPSHVLQNLAESENFEQAAQKMVQGRFSETKELRDLWNKASNGQTLSYEVAQNKFWNMVKESTDPDAILVKQTLDKAGIKFNEKLGRFAIDPKSVGLFSKYTNVEAQNLLKTLCNASSVTNSMIGKVASAAGKVVAAVGPIFEAKELQEHMENRTLPGFMGLWKWVTPESHNLDYPNGTRVYDMNGNIVGYIHDGRVVYDYLRYGDPNGA